MPEHMQGQGIPDIEIVNKPNFHDGGMPFGGFPNLFGGGGACGGSGLFGAGALGFVIGTLLNGCGGGGLWGNKGAAGVTGVETLLFANQKDTINSTAAASDALLNSSFKFMENQMNTLLASQKDSENRGLATALNVAQTENLKLSNQLVACDTVKQIVAEVAPQFALINGRLCGLEKGQDQTNCLIVTTAKDQEIAVLKSALADAKSCCSHIPVVPTPPITPETINSIVINNINQIVGSPAFANAVANSVANAVRSMGLSAK